MKKRLSVIAVLVLTCLTAFFMSGCGKNNGADKTPAGSGNSNVTTIVHSTDSVTPTEMPTEMPKDDNGLLFVPTSEYLTDEKNAPVVSNYGLKSILEDTEGYVCFVTAFTPADLVIPDTYNDLPVLAVTDADNQRIQLKSLTIGKNVRVLFGFLNSVDSTLHDIVIPANVTSIVSAFYYLKDATITFEGNPHMSFVFWYSKSIRLVVGDADMLTQLKESSLFHFEDKLSAEDAEIGTKEYFDYTAGLDTEALLERGVSHFQEKLDSGKEVTPEKAAGYASFLDGPVVHMSLCPAIYSKDYFTTDRDALLAECAPEYMDPRDAAERYPEDYYSPKTETPKVYFIIEKTGGEFAGYTSMIYYMYFRISVRDIETDELICWFTARPGYAPKTLKVGGVDSGVFGENGRSYLRDESKQSTTSLYCLHRYFPAK
jgi:hypothetical protein